MHCQERYVGRMVLLEIGGFKYFRMLFSIHREVVKAATIHETLSDSRTHTVCESLE